MSPKVAKKRRVRELALHSATRLGFKKRKLNKRWNGLDEHTGIEKGRKRADSLEQREEHTLGAPITFPGRKLEALARFAYSV